MDWALVGGACLSASLQVLFDRMASRRVLDFIRARKHTKKLLKKLKTTLLSINAMLSEAEEKQEKSLADKESVDCLKDAVSEAIDLLDQIYKTEASQSKLEAEFQSNPGQVQNLMKGIELKLEGIIEKLKVLVKSKDSPVDATEQESLDEWVVVEQQTN